MRAAGLLHAGNLIPVHEALRIREDRKYAEVRASLVKMGTSHTFEHPIEHADGFYIFDLFLPDHQALIEFDGPYHNDPAQQERDAEKTKVAEASGLIVVRIQTSDDVIPATVIPKIMMEIQAVRMRQLVEVSNALHATTKDKPSYILIGPYAEKPPVLRQLIEENADRMRQQFAEQGLDFDAWRAGQPFKRSDSRP